MQLSLLYNEVNVINVNVPQLAVSITIMKNSKKIQKALLSIDLRAKEGAG